MPQAPRPIPYRDLPAFNTMNLLWAKHNVTNADAWLLASPVDDDMFLYMEWRTGNSVTKIWEMHRVDRIGGAFVLTEIGRGDGSNLPETYMLEKRAVNQTWALPMWRAWLALHYDRVLPLLRRLIPETVARTVRAHYFAVPDCLDPTSGQKNHFDEAAKRGWPKGKRRGPKRNPLEGLGL